MKPAISEDAPGIQARQADCKSVPRVNTRREMLVNMARMAFGLRNHVSFVGITVNASEELPVRGW